MTVVGSLRRSSSRCRRNPGFRLLRLDGAVVRAIYGEVVDVHIEDARRKTDTDMCVMSPGTGTSDDANSGSMMPPIREIESGLAAVEAANQHRRGLRHGIYRLVAIAKGLKTCFCHHVLQYVSEVAVVAFRCTLLEAVMGPMKEAKEDDACCQTL